MDVKEAVTHPISLVSGVIGALASIGFDPATAVVMATWANLGTLFPAVSIVASDLAPAIPAIPEQTAQTLSLVLGGLFVLKLLSDAWDKYENKL